MQFKKAGYIVTIKPLLLLVFIVLLTLLMRLGFWQLDRAELKTAIQSRQKIALAKPVIAIESSEFLITDNALRNVRFKGQLLTEQFLHDNRVYKGKAGYDVLSVVRLIGEDKLVLINRGWVLAPQDRQTLPDVTFPQKLENQVVSLQGVWSYPSSGISLISSQESDSDSWPKVIQQITKDGIEAYFEEDLVLGVLQLQLGDMPRFVPRWEPVASDPLKNYSYSFQWFAMALALTILMIVVSVRRNKEIVI